MLGLRIFNFVQKIAAAFVRSAVFISIPALELIKHPRKTHERVTE